MLLVQFGRGRGKKIESKLFLLWGGKPSVTMLRHRDTYLPDSVKQRYKSFLERHVPNLQLASAKDEQTSPHQADKSYDSAISWLLAQTRDQKHFPLIFKENVNYGFRRNTWGLKPLALCLDGALVVAFLLINFSTEKVIETFQTISTHSWIFMILTVIHMLIFTLVIRHNWVRIVAVEYARQLLAACDTLSQRR